MIREKLPKFDKKKCATCKYHGERLQYNAESQNTHCDYANIMGITCLTYGEHGKVIDRRGCDGQNCALYEKGAMIQKRKGAGQWI